MIALAYPICLYVGQVYSVDKNLLQRLHRIVVKRRILLVSLL